ncbi:MAG: TIGR03668 family PPOX class F420-dependent oxidoreductase [Deltaproteobacteria bacterium]|nr:TIGR03668 family PPOX class F420-dependent oxidoreductase [Deltaproteobacteria bacterium]
MRLSKRIKAFVSAARVAHLATADKHGQPHVIPICFVFDGKQFFSPIDEKPKRVAPNQLKRVRNIRENPRVSLVVDRYDENWRRLAYVLIHGSAKILTKGKRHAQAIRQLRRKYRQYRSMNLVTRPVIVIAAREFRSWGRC